MSHTCNGFKFQSYPQFTFLKWAHGVDSNFKVMINLYFPNKYSIAINKTI